VNRPEEKRLSRFWINSRDKTGGKATELRIERSNRNWRCVEVPEALMTFPVAISDSCEQTLGEIVSQCHQAEFHGYLLQSPQPEPPPVALFF